MQSVPEQSDKSVAADGGESPRRIQSVDRAIELLKAVSASRTPRTVGDLADACGINRSTAWRLLMTLEHQGLIDRDPVSQRYVIGYEVLRLAAGASAHELIASRARPIMDSLSHEAEETVSLVVPTPRGTVAIDQAYPRNIPAVSVIGVHLPLHATASGKLWLAHLSDAERAEQLTLPLARLSGNTLTDPTSLAAELDLVLKQGYAVERDEFEAGVSGLAAPIFDARGHIAASISISGLTARLPRERLQELAPKVRAAAAAVSDALRGDRSPGKPDEAAEQSAQVDARARQSTVS